MLDALPALLGLLAFGLPLPLAVAAYILARRWRLRGAEPGIQALLSARPLGLIGLAVCVVTGAVGFAVPFTSLGGFAGNTAAVALMALACAGGSLGAAAFGQRRARWAGALAILLGLAEWLTGATLLFLANVGMGMPGRPLRVRGVPVLPKVRRGSRQPDGPEDATRRGPLTERTRRALARAWEDDARYEAASAPAFEHLARDLEAARAPEHLIVSARRAADDEAGHASLCFALASSYAGRPLTASPLPYAPSWARRAETRSALLERLAIESLIEGCVGEGAAALGAALGAERANDPAVKAALQRIAREEETHAELAWAILGWLLDEKPRLASVLSARLERLAIEPRDARQRAVPANLARHGRLSPAERRAHLVQAREQARQRLAALQVYPSFAWGPGPWQRGSVLR